MIACEAFCGLRNDQSSFRENKNLIFQLKPCSDGIRASRRAFVLANSCRQRRGPTPHPPLPAREVPQNLVPRQKTWPHPAPLQVQQGGLPLQEAPAACTAPVSAAPEAQNLSCPAALPAGGPGTLQPPLAHPRLGSSHGARAGSETQAQGEERVSEPPRHPCLGHTPRPHLPAQSPAPAPSAGAAVALAHPPFVAPLPPPPPHVPGTSPSPPPSPPPSPHSPALPAREEKYQNLEGAGRTQRREHSGQDQNSEGKLEGVHNDGHPGQELCGGCRGSGLAGCPAPHPPSGCSLPRGSQESHSRAEHGPDPSAREARVFPQPGGSPGWWPFDGGLPGSWDTSKSDARAGPSPASRAALPGASVSPAGQRTASEGACGPGALGGRVTRRSAAAQRSEPLGLRSLPPTLPFLPASLRNQFAAGSWANHKYTDFPSHQERVGQRPPRRAAPPAGQRAPV